MGGARRLAGAALLLCAAGLAIAWGAAAYSTPGGTGALTLDSMGAPPSAVWHVSIAPSVYQVNETIVVSAGDTLQIAAGTTINFVNTTELIVLGGIEVLGTPSDPVQLGVVPDLMSMAVAWGGLRAQAASSFVLENVRFSDNIDVAYANASGALLTNVTYQGRLYFDNASGVSATGLLMTITPTDVGRIALWIQSSDLVTVVGADLQGGNGWGGAAVLVDTSSDIVIRDLTVRVDNANLIGLLVASSVGVSVSNYVFTVGPMGGDPNTALDVRESDAIVVDHLTITHVGQTGVGAIYGVSSNATISNSTFDPAVAQGVWQLNGTLKSVNATNLPVRPEGGAVLEEYELVRVAARWDAGGAVDLGTARLTNASWNISGPITAGSSAWLWALRSVNASGAVALSESYRADVTCNCTAGVAFLNLSDSPGFSVVVFVGDTAPPVVLASIPQPSTDASVTLDASASFDNAGVAAFLWTVVDGTNISGLPCAAARCEVLFEAPGNTTIQLNVTDTAALRTTMRFRILVADATAPVVSVAGVSVARPGQGEPFQVTVDAEDNDPTFLPLVEWYVDGVRVAGDSLALNLHIDTIGAHAIVIIVRDDGGNTANASVVVTIKDGIAPEVGLWTAPEGLTPPATVQLNGGVATDNVAVVAWRWRISGPGTDYNLTGPTPNATFPAAGSYNVTLTAEDAEGNQAGRTFAVVVSAPAGSSGDGTLPLLLLVGVGAVAAVAVAAFVLRKPKGPSKDREPPHSDERDGEV